MVRRCGAPGKDPAGRIVRHARAVDSEQPRPTVITVMAEHGVVDPAWDRPSGTGDPLDLSALGVSAALVRRLRDWNGVLDVLSEHDFAWPTPTARVEWERTGLDLAFALQGELWDVEVRYWEGDPAQRALPVRRRRP